MEETEIDLLIFFKIFRKRIKLIIFVAIVGGIISYTITDKYVQPKYSTSTSMIVVLDTDNVEENQLSLNTIKTNQALVDTYTELIKTRGLANIVIESLNLKMSENDLLEKIVVTTTSNQTEIFSINVKDTDPQRAIDIANKTAEVFKVTVKKIMNLENIHVLDPAYEAELVSPNIFLNTFLGALIPVIIVLAISLIKELLDTSVKSSEELEELFDIPVLAELSKFK